MHTALILTVTTLMLPTLAFADDIDPDLTYLDGLGTQSVDLLDILIGLVVTLALLAFFWGLAVFIFNAGDEEGRRKGRNIMVWGVLALFFIVAVWGLVALLTQIFLGGEAGEDADVPGVAGRG